MAASTRGVCWFGRARFSGARAAIISKQLNAGRRISLKYLRTCASLDVASTQVLMPALSPTMETGTIVSWLKKEGDTIEPGDALCEIETDKATLTLDTDEQGVLAKIVIPPGTKNVKVNELIALIVEEGEDYTKVVVPVTGSTGTSDEAEDEAQSSATPHKGSLLSFSPAVRYMLETNKIDSSAIPATGPHGRLLKGDILRFLAQGGSAETASKPPPPPTQVSVHPPQGQAPPVVSSARKAVPQPVTPATPSPGTFTDVPNTEMRREIAKRLLKSKTTIPHVYASTDCVMDNLLQLKSHLKERGLTVSVNDLLVKVAAVCLRKVPEMNAVWNGYSYKGP
ncbi:pyruvate dehydrogenase protein X component, mitochondrial isoform X2 [Nematostella vectensis]|uniref:pyruvate dehydrogenase protein X component, mitochondrial isoform X2 n=1 Tax=Nematostella vectensis TaxID=45351 RepID=UPI0020772468|nr:pyruvate dehydrogenase protein X component, mitochondrial isoform X2 [Nematostella vectensis]